MDNDSSFCDSVYCEAEATASVKVSINAAHDAERSYCESCQDVYYVGVQHGRFHEAANYGLQPLEDTAQKKPTPEQIAKNRQVFLNSFSLKELRAAITSKEQQK